MSVRQCAILIVALLAVGAHGGPVFVQAEQFRYPGDWHLQGGEPNALGRVLICTVEQSRHPAVVAVNVPAAGRYQLMVRARDFPNDRPGIRRFAVEVNSRRSAVEFGAHRNPNPGAQGWQWESGGLFDLPAGPAVIALCAVTAYCRCDAVALVAEGEPVPRTIGAARAARRPLPELSVTGAPELSLPRAETVGTAPLASLANQRVRLDFLPCRAGGADTVALRVAARQGEQWREVSPPALEAYQVLHCVADTQIDPRGAGVWPAWSPARRFTCRVGLGQTFYETAFGSDQWLPCAGEPVALLPSPKLSATATEVRLSAGAAVGRATAVWRLDADDAAPRLEVRFRAAQAGVYGLGYSVGPAVPAAQVEEVLCPFLHQYRRLPGEPKLILTEMCSTPLALIQVGGAVRGVALDPAALPPHWPDLRRIRSGFQLAQVGGAIVPTVWDPVPGGSGSALAAGGEAVLRARLVTGTAGWFATWRDTAEQVYGLRDYRHNAEVSLTDTALNVIDLLKDNQASGWSDDGLGPWNIEGANAVTQAAPLAILSAALVTGDEDLLARRAIPSLAHLLSRPGTHFSVDPAAQAGLGSKRLGGPMALYGATVRLGAAALCRGYAPAFRALALDERGAPRVTAGYGKHRPFEDALAAWRATGETRYRDLARADLASYRGYAERQTEDIDPNAFYQLTYTGDWEGLLHASEQLSDDAAGREAAALAQRMVSGLFVRPLEPLQPLVVHRGGRFEGNGYVWWRGADLFHLGVTAKPGGEPLERRLEALSVPEETVPAWLTSIVGLGIEQPTTYRRLRTPCAPIVMANWAPALLRLAAASGERVFRTAAHNAVLGRWANYPGYYVTGDNNRMRQADYPYRGPDLSGLYVHHIPPFLALLLDYLVTDVEVRSQGQVRFPHERQCGYAWFDNRVYGHQPGRVYDQDGAWLWLRRDLVRLDTSLLNWLAAHSDDRVWVLLTNTAGQPVASRVRLDVAATGGARGPVTVRVDNGAPQPLALRDGAVTITVPPQGLAVVEWRGCRPQVALHQTPPAPAVGAGQALLAEPWGTVRANWLGVGPAHNWLHVYSDHDGSRATAAELTLTQGGQTRRWRRERWPFEFIVPVRHGSPVEVRLTLYGADGQAAGGGPLPVAGP